MDNQTQMLIQTADLWKTYQAGDTVLHALKGINLSVADNEFIAIMGSSGSGKSTLMHILGCLDKATKGAYLLENTDTQLMNSNQLAKIRRYRFGFVFQSYNLLTRTTAYENVELPLLYGSKYSSSERKKLVLKALDSVGLQSKILSNTNQLSGGQQQRVAIARAIVNNPAIIFADEPTGNLDTRTSFEIMAILQKLHKQGATIIIVTHENDIADFTSRKIIFKDGKIISDSINPDPKNAEYELKNYPVEV